jgi:methylmalonyl-CoA mutase
MMEKLTQDMADKAWAIIEEVEAMGGMTKAVESGWAKLKIEECAAEKQARIDSGKDVIVGVNKYKLAKEDPVDILEIDNHGCASADRALARIRKMRDQAAVDAALAALTAAPRAAKATCWIWPSRPCACAPPSARSPMRWKPSSAATAPIRSGHGRLQLGGRRQRRLAGAQGRHRGLRRRRRPPSRIMIAKLGQDGHDRGAKVVATAFADLGFDVDIGPLFQTPEGRPPGHRERRARRGLLQLAAGHKTLVPAIIKALKEQGADDIIVSSAA